MNRRRPKTNLSFMYIAFIIGVSMILASLFLAVFNDVFAFVKPNEQITIEIPRKSNSRDIAKILGKADVVSFPSLFQIMAKNANKAEKYVYGEVTVNKSLDYRLLIRALSRPADALDTVRVTITEGMEVKQIVDLLVKNEVCDKESLEEVLRSGVFDFDFVQSLPEGQLNRLEGYLFPDTYEFYAPDKPHAVVQKMLANFDKKFTEDMAKQAEANGFTTHELITLASIIEREATGSDKKLVASVFYNRLNSKRYKYLESCATVQYILGKHKAKLSISDTKIENPYNTYRNAGLPPGPISNPGLSSINAALYPAKTNYLFFALQKDGTHKFTETFEQHQKVTGT